MSAPRMMRGLLPSALAMAGRASESEDDLVFFMKKNGAESSRDSSISGTSRIDEKDYGSILEIEEAGVEEESKAIADTSKDGTNSESESESEEELITNLVDVVLTVKQVRGLNFRVGEKEEIFVHKPHMSLYDDSTLPLHVTHSSRLVAMNGQMIRGYADFQTFLDLLSSSTAVSINIPQGLSIKSALSLSGAPAPLAAPGAGVGISEIGGGPSLSARPCSLRFLLAPSYKKSPDTDTAVGVGVGVEKRGGEDESCLEPSKGDSYPDGGKREEKEVVSLFSTPQIPLSAAPLRSPRYGNIENKNNNNNDNDCDNNDNNNDNDCDNNSNNSDNNSDSDNDNDNSLRGDIISQASLLYRRTYKALYRKDDSEPEQHQQDIGYGDGNNENSPISPKQAKPEYKHAKHVAFEKKYAHLSKLEVQYSEVLSLLAEADADGQEVEGTATQVPNQTKASKASKARGGGFGSMLRASVDSIRASVASLRPQRGLTPSPSPYLAQGGQGEGQKWDHHQRDKFALTPDQQGRDGRHFPSFPFSPSPPSSPASPASPSLSPSSVFIHGSKGTPSPPLSPSTAGVEIRLTVLVLQDLAVLYSWQREYQKSCSVKEEEVHLWRMVVRNSKVPPHSRLEKAQYELSRVRKKLERDREREKERKRGRGCSLELP